MVQLPDLGLHYTSFSDHFRANILLNNHLQVLGKLPKYIFEYKGHEYIYMVFDLEKRKREKSKTRILVPTKIFG